ncbi:MAG: hypothetical protein L0209_06890 [candidate division Zixibacteria bacterium]|nr:hypothetical protein [candidate division Zixibacteria bacterium]
MSADLRALTGLEMLELAKKFCDEIFITRYEWTFKEWRDENHRVMTYVGPADEIFELRWNRIKP